MMKTYNEMSTLSTFEDRYNYLKTTNRVGDETFGSHRYLNQKFYTTPEWKRFRSQIILRDNGCDLGIPGREISGKVYIHHINPITIQDIMDRNPCLLDPNNVVCCSDITHQAIHYGDSNLLRQEPVARKANDTCPWK